MLPEASKKDIVRAFDEFDGSMRWTDTWKGWEERESHKYAVEYDGRRYPPKMILSLASGRPVDSFSGGLRAANKVLANHGFKIVKLHEGRASSTPQVWWVNQGATYEESVGGGVLWFPRRNKDKGPPGPWKRLREVQPNDVLVHHSNTAIRAIARVKTAATEARRPSRRKDQATDDQRVEVEYFGLDDRAVPIDRVRDLFRNLVLDEGPFTKKYDIKPGLIWRFTEAGLQLLKQEVGEPWPSWANMTGPPEVPFNLGTAVQQLTDAIAKRGFVFEPWQVATFVTAVRTKPFVILAGVSGTGKSRLPCLVADATGCTSMVIPVRPDWTDSSDVLGYVDLQSAFRPGPLLQAAEQAGREAGRFHLCVIDEMNLARVEHYFAEVLSRIEDRTLSPDGRHESKPLFNAPLADADARWGDVGLPSNLAIVGTVNMDESAHGFSRKVLDRAFTLELSDFDLRQWNVVTSDYRTIHWPTAAWSASATQLSQRATSDENKKIINQVIDTLIAVNRILAQAQLQVGYRTRDEVAAFVLNARDAEASFVTREGIEVTPLDLALLMKILPRIAGGSAPVRQVVLGLLGFAYKGKPLEDEQAEAIVSQWRSSNRIPAIEDATFPRTAARLCLMWDRLITEGYTSFWL